MGSEELFGKTITVLEKTLDLRSLRHDAIVTNIANVDTPHYQAFDTVLEEAMQKTVGPEQNLELKRTNPSHFPKEEIKMNHAKTQTISKSPWKSKGDDNSVNIDQEMVKLAENGMMYSALSQILSKKFKGIENVISEGKR